MWLHHRADGTKVPFLSSNTLHIVDRVMWMLPFVTVTDLNEACKKADVSHETRNLFLQKMLAEHSAIGSREQLKELWAAWVLNNYPMAMADQDEAGGNFFIMDAATPPDLGGEGSSAPGGDAAATGPAPSTNGPC